jgi:hypothetical protein
VPDSAGGSDAAGRSGTAQGHDATWDSASEWGAQQADFPDRERGPAFLRGLGSYARGLGGATRADPANGADSGHGDAGRGRGSGEPGLAGWVAVLLLIGIAAIGAIIDEVNGNSIRGWFNWSLVIASLIAILVVKRSAMFGVVVAPPLVYFIASAALLYLRSGGLQDRKVLIDAAANWLVYGFPAIAGATAVVLVIAGIRMIVRR